jgi:hypothetical protein
VPRLTDINGEQHGQLAEALADAFDQQSLTEMVRVKLNQTLAKIFANALPAMLGWIPFGKRGPRENKTADEALYAEQQAHMADAVEKLRRLALGE